jgi:hypothetical protein
MKNLQWKGLKVTPQTSGKDLAKDLYRAVDCTINFEIPKPKPSAREDFTE